MATPAHGEFHGFRRCLVLVVVLLALLVLYAGQHRIALVQPRLPQQVLQAAAVKITCARARERFFAEYMQSMSGATVRKDYKCGPLVKDGNGNAVICDPQSKDSCCSAGGWCGGGRMHCEPKHGGKNYRPGWQRAEDLPEIRSSKELASTPVKYIGCLQCEKAIVVAAYLDVLTWLEPLTLTHRIAVYMLPSADPNVPECIGSTAYASGSTLNTHTPNIACEHGRYLSYIVQEYHHLPEYIMFLHADANSWHDRCGGVRNESMKIRMIEKWEWDHKCIRFLPSYCKHWSNEASAIAWYKEREHTLFQELQPLKQDWQTPCCGQFAVHRDQIRKRPWSFYANLYDHLMEPGRYQVAHDVPAHYLEMMWVQLLGSMCPDTQHCLEHNGLGNPWRHANQPNAPITCNPER